MNIEKLKNIFSKKKRMPIFKPISEERIKAALSKVNVKNLRNIFKKKKKVIFALEIGREWIKAAVSEEDKDGFKIINLAAARTAGNEERAIAEAIKGLIRKLKLHQFMLVISLPRHSVTVRYLRFPSVNPAEIEEMAKLQAIKQLPYPKDELIIAHKILERDVEGYSKVMLVAVHRNVLNKYLNILKMNGLEPELIALSSEAINQYYAVTKSLTKEEAHDAIALIDIDLFFTEIQIQRKGNLIFSRSLHHGLGNFEDENQRRNWIEEIKLSFNTYAREKDSVDITQVVLTGAAWKKTDLDKIFNKELKLPVKAVSPLQNIRITSEAKSKFKTSDYSLSFSSVTALALNYQQLQINLLPCSIQLAHEKRTKYKRLINIGVLVGCLILVLGIFFFKKLHDKEIFVDILKQKLESIAPEAEVLNKKAKMARIITQQLKAKGSCLDVIREVHGITPQNIYLTKLIFDEGKGVTLKGSSPSMAQIFKFITVLENSEYFKNVQLRYASKRKRKGADITDFEIYTPLK